MAKKKKEKRTGDSAEMEKGRRALLEFVKQRRQFETREAADRANRLLTSELNHRKLLSSITAKTGFDLGAFDRERQRDWESLLKDAARQQKEAIPILRQQRVRKGVRSGHRGHRRRC